MAKATVVVTAIHNRTRDTITIPHQQRGPIEIEPGETLDGPFVDTYDPEKEGMIRRRTRPDSSTPPTSFKWGTFSLPAVDPG